MNIRDRIQLAKKSLTGITIGDAFGESFFGNSSSIAAHIEAQTLPKTSWQFTDDSIMSIAVFEELETDGKIDPERLINKFCRNHDIDPRRGYGATVRRLLREIGEGAAWQKITREAFDGQGSMGNGAAMRSGTIGAFYFDDINKIKEYSTTAALVTHANKEAVTGAMAISIATALATKASLEGIQFEKGEFLNLIIQELEECETKAKLIKATTIDYSFRIETVSKILGNGIYMTAQDTVPIAIWCAANNLSNFEASLWKAVSALGDRDTICAMVGGITIMSSIPAYIPTFWTAAVEKFETSPFRNVNNGNEQQGNYESNTFT